MLTYTIGCNTKLDTHDAQIKYLMFFAISRPLVTQSECAEYKQSYKQYNIQMANNRIMQSTRTITQCDLLYSLFIII